MPFLLWGGHLSPSFNVSAFLACWIFEWKIEWDPTYFVDASTTKTTDSSAKQRKRHRNDSVKRYALFVLGAVVFSAIFTAAMYQHLQVDMNGQHIKVKDVVADYFKPGGLLLLYRQLSGVVNEFCSFLRQFGVRGLWAEVWTTLNYPSEAQAFKVRDPMTTKSCSFGQDFVASLYRWPSRSLGSQSLHGCVAERNRSTMSNISTSMASGQISGTSLRTAP